MKFKTCDKHCLCTNRHRQPACRHSGSSGYPSQPPPRRSKRQKQDGAELVAFDVSPALRDLPKAAAPKAVDDPDAEPVDIRPDRGSKPEDNGFSGDGAAAAAPLIQIHDGTSRFHPGAPCQF